MMGTVRLVVVEDDALIAADLAGMLHDLGYTVCAICTGPGHAVAAIAAHAPDIVLLDIHLGTERDGVDLADQCNASDIPFIFITGHTDSTTLDRVKSVRPAGFIIKPFDEDDLRTQIEIALARRTGEGADDTPARSSVPEHVIFVRDKGRLVKLPVDEIIHAEADDNYVILHTAARRYTITSTLTAVEEQLNSPHFMRIHRSFLVDLRRVTSIREKDVVLDDLTLPVGRTHRAALRERWMQGPGRISMDDVRPD